MHNRFVGFLSGGRGGGGVGGEGDGVGGEGVVWRVRGWWGW